MIVYQVYSHEGMSDGDGWYHWIDRIPLTGINLYFKQEDALKRIEEELNLEIDFFNQQIKPNSTNNDYFERKINGLKNNMAEYRIHVKDSEVRPRFGITELTII